jgi:hypothetical protein
MMSASLLVPYTLWHSWLGTLVHYLDVDGVQPPETTGVESALASLREVILEDDQLLAAASSVFDGLLGTFEKEVTAP